MCYLRSGRSWGVAGCWVVSFGKGEARGSATPSPGAEARKGTLHLAPFGAQPTPLCRGPFRVQRQSWSGVSGATGSEKTLLYFHISCRKGLTEPGDSRRAAPRSALPRQRAEAAHAVVSTRTLRAHSQQPRLTSAKWATWTSFRPGLAGQSGEIRF